MAFFFGCTEKALKRPYGYLRVGPIADFAAAETYLPDKLLVVRHDADGISVMSTLCTHDLTPLVLKNAANGEAVFVSTYSESVYKKDGTVIHGPAVANLPYYKAKIDEGVYGGPKDTLYVEIGKEVSPETRVAFMLPAATGNSQQVSSSSVPAHQ